MTTYLQVRTNEADKEAAGRILEQLGTNFSSVINMLLKQIVLTKSIPFDIKLPDNNPVAMGNLTKSQLDDELRKGLESSENQECLSVAEVDENFKSEFGI